MHLKHEDARGTQLLREGGVVYQITTVQRNGRADNSRPRIQFNGDWLPAIGFIDGALVQSLPEPGDGSSAPGFAFKLCNENIGNYSDLFNETREKGGTLIKVCLNSNSKQAGFVTTGTHIYKGGLAVGDALVARCEQGCIRVRKVVGDTRLVYVARTKKPHTGEPVPMVFLMGDWLNEIGFTSDTLMTVEAKPACITFTAHNKEIIYSEIVKYARQNKLKLIQVSVKDGAPLIHLMGSCVAEAGFRLGEVFVADYSFGVIKLQKLDPARFGFAAS